MNIAEFEWDTKKSEANLQKHGITFEESMHVFADPFAVEVFDSKHSNQSENRWKIIGCIKNILLVCVITTENNGKVRLISAREANRKEKEDYSENINIIFRN